ncbi:hypothetical protein EB796_009182 [Bugula neritina]|uniref:Uncharacterized protein n=1 Tax=Bugula neritina TaxID=10212 RepID=A0A7J7K3M7_BUGNE|nr:hypothetical protein EB796_009182 [Bugula neritina]
MSSLHYVAATLISLAPIIMCELVGLEKLTNGFGLLCLVRGVTAIAGPPIVGMLYDITGDYSATFYAGGACLIACGALHFLLHLKYFKGKTD